jgi:hypothetical protein
VAIPTKKERIPRGINIKQKLAKHFVDTRVAMEEGEEAWVSMQSILAFCVAGL